MTDSDFINMPIVRSRIYRATSYFDEISKCPFADFYCSRRTDRNGRSIGRQYVTMRGSRFSMRMRLGTQNVFLDPPPKYTVPLLVAKRWLSRAMKRLESGGGPTLGIRNPSKLVRDKSQILPLAHWLSHHILVDRYGLHPSSRNAIHDDLEYELKHFLVMQTGKEILLIDERKADFSRVYAARHLISTMRG